MKYNFHTYKDTAGHWRWRLTAPNGQIIASSGESFYSLENARRSAELVRSVAGSATVD